MELGPSDQRPCPTNLFCFLHTPQVVSSAVQCMCALSRPHPNLVTQQIVGLAARYHLMLENDLNGGITETSPYRGMYPK
eukprot:1070621-Pelagomonas_calceolata.AAC.1